jgi:hypothetical protein
VIANPDQANDALQVNVLQVGKAGPSVAEQAYVGGYCEAARRRVVGAFDAIRLMLNNVLLPSRQPVPKPTGRTITGIQVRASHCAVSEGQAAELLSPATATLA